MKQSQSYTHTHHFPFLSFSCNRPHQHRFDHICDRPTPKNPKETNIKNSMVSIISVALYVCPHAQMSFLIVYFLSLFVFPSSFFDCILMPDGDGLHAPKTVIYTCFIYQSEYIRFNRFYMRFCRFENIKSTNFWWYYSIRWVFICYHLSKQTNI